MMTSWSLAWWRPIGWSAIVLGSEARRPRSFERSAEPEHQAAIDLHQRRPSAKSTIAFSRLSPLGCTIRLGSIWRRPKAVLVQTPEGQIRSNPITTR